MNASGNVTGVVMTSVHVGAVAVGIRDAVKIVASVSANVENVVALVVIAALRVETAPVSRNAKIAAVIVRTAVTTQNIWRNSKFNDAFAGNVCWPKAPLCSSVVSSRRVRKWDSVLPSVCMGSRPHCVVH